jgi:hypothetical protein
MDHALLLENKVLSYGFHDVKLVPCCLWTRGGTNSCKYVQLIFKSGDLDGHGKVSIFCCCKAFYAIVPCQAEI